MLIVPALLCGLAACSSPAEPPTATRETSELAALQEQVAAQATRIATLEAQGSLAETVSAQATRIAVLETQAAPAPTLPPTATPEATAVPPTLTPTPALGAPVAGLLTDGTTKGAADAPVTITEYTDYL